MSAHGRIVGARPTTPAFSGRIVKVTGEGEHVEIAFTAADAAELAERLTAAGAATSARMMANNDAIVRAGDTFEERQRKVYEAAKDSLRRELGLEEPAAVDEGNHADDAGGPIHTPAHP